MKFTDDDLKRLKLAGQECAPDECYEIEFQELKALLVRLEAAEKVCEYFYHMPDKEEIWPYAEKAIEAWCKAKGEKI